MVKVVKVSKKSEYAICALTEMALRSSQGAEWVQIAQIAGSTGIPEKFLEQILLTLKKAGFLQSRRGVEGGYALKLPAEKINLAQVIDLLEGNTGEEPSPVGKRNECRDLLFHYVEKSDQAAHQVLQGVSISKLAAECMALRARKSALEYHI
jgi:Rrf2 family protein